MRDAFGGAFMIKLFLVFILIYICFTAVALNYAKAFKVKNKVIDYLENNEITNLNDLTASELEAMNLFIEEEVLGNMNYNASGYNICSGRNTTDALGRTIEICHESGIIITETGRATNTEGVYYTVSTFVSWSVPFINRLLEVNGDKSNEGTLSGLWTISGETRLIVNE